MKIPKFLPLRALKEIESISSSLSPITAIKEEEIDSVALRALNGRNLGIFNLPNLFKLMDELIEKKGRTK